jgi:hypothetical protein
MNSFLISLVVSSAVLALAAWVMVGQALRPLLKHAQLAQSREDEMQRLVQQVVTRISENKNPGVGARVPELGRR